MLCIEHSEAFNHQFLQGQIIEGRLLIFGSKGHFGAASRDSLYAVNIRLPLAQ
ncbi:MAG: hypothetical protein ACI8P7_000885 [Candidatus Azotimanducaceae bacterium]|jgi:hypothetical protein